MTAIELAQKINQIRGQENPIQLAMVLGSGLAGFIDEIENPCVIPYQELPGFPGTGVEGHSPNLVIGELEGIEVAVLGGRSHYYEHGDAAIMRLPLETLKALGIENLLLTNSAGTAHNDLTTGDLMLITDHINLSGANPLIGEATNDRFVNMSKAYDESLQNMMRTAASSLQFKMQEGIYAWFSGPNFETPAEVRMAHTLGADALGMSTVPEVILANFLNMKVVAISNITNPGAGLSEIVISHQQTQDAAAASAENFSRLLKAFLKQYNS